MLQVLLIGGVVCTALSMSGSLVTQYKIGYWLGATPRRIEIANLVGAVLASAATTAVILLMARVYGFAPSPEHAAPLAAPQPNAMAAVLRGVMGDAGTPWFLYAIGGVFAVAAEMCSVSGLAFALGMYLPMELNSPLVLGAAVAWLLRRSSQDARDGRRAPRGGHARRLGLHRGRGARRRAGGPAAIRRGRLREAVRAGPHRAARAPAPGSPPGATGTASPSSCCWASASTGTLVGPRARFAIAPPGGWRALDSGPATPPGPRHGAHRPTRRLPTSCGSRLRERSSP